MANVVDEFEVRITADTSKLLKEIKTLRKSFTDIFHNKDLYREVGMLKSDLSDMSKILALSPFRSWGNDIKTVERTLKEQGFKPIKKEIDDIQKKIQKMNAGKNGTKQGIGFATNLKAELAELKRYQASGYVFDPRKTVGRIMGMEWGENLIRERAHFKLLQNRFGDVGNIKGKLSELKELEELRRQFGSNIFRVTEQGSVNISEEITQRIGELSKERGKLEFALKQYSKYDADKQLTFKAMDEREQQLFSKQKKMMENYLPEKTLKEKLKPSNIFRGIWNKIMELPRMLGRILTRYLGYQLIKNMFGDVQQGMQNLYEWSRYHNHVFADILDKSKSLKTALGNATAVFKTYVTMWFERIGSSFKEMMIDFLNVLSKAMAFLLGQKTYIQANKDIMVRWSENNT